MIEEPVGQYASMHGKVPVEQVAQQVKETVDEHDVRELERVAKNKVVRCAKNQIPNPSPPQRPTRTMVSRPSQTIPQSGSESSGHLYEDNGTPHEEQADGQGDGDRQSMLEEGEYESIQEDESDEGPRDEHAATTVLERDIQDAQGEEEPSLEILKEVHNHTTSGPSTSQKKDQNPTLESIPRRA